MPQIFLDLASNPWTVLFVICPTVIALAFFIGGILQYYSDRWFLGKKTSLWDCFNAKK